MSAANIERFNAEAAAWDSNPDVDRASEDAFKAILQAFPRLEQYKAGQTDGLNAVEIGCGTGLLSLRVGPYLKSLVAVDTAQAMIDALRIKLDTIEGASKTIETLCLEVKPDTLHDLLPADGFDLALSHLVLHHIPDLKQFLEALLRLLRPGGWACLTDYQEVGPESRRFHPEARLSGVERHGIDAKWFANLLEEAGFENVVVSAAWSMSKAVEREPGEWGGLDGQKEFQKPEESTCARQEFPFLLCKGRKSARPQ